MIKWNKHRINGSYAHGLSFGGYRVRQIPTRICVSRERFGTNIIAGKPSSTVFCCLKVSFTIKWKKKEKLSNRLTAAILKEFRLENMECRKYQLIFVTAEEVLSKPIFFSGWTKNCFTVSLTGSTCVCFCRMTMVPVFNLTHFDWLPTHFRKCSDAQILRYYTGVLSNGLFERASSRPSPAPYSHRRL